jgi:hypothetical protein
MTLPPRIRALIARNNRNNPRRQPPQRRVTVQDASMELSNMGLFGPVGVSTAGETTEEEVDLSSDITAYQSAIEDAGGTVTAGEVELWNIFYSTEYDDGDSGTGAVGEFKDKFDLLWIPGLDLTTITKPLIGDDLTNSGFTSDDLSVNGLANNSNSLTTALALSDLVLQDSHAYYEGSSTGGDCHRFGYWRSGRC